MTFVGVVGKTYDGGRGISANHTFVVLHLGGCSVLSSLLIGGAQIQLDSV